MEPELERPRREKPRSEKIKKPNLAPGVPTPSPIPASAHTRQQPDKLTEMVISATRLLCLTLGSTLVIIGLIGFVMQNFLWAHLSYVHNVIHIITGVAAIAVGYYSTRASINFSAGVGSFYTIIGIFGFVLGQRGIPTIGSKMEDRFLWQIKPEVLEFGTADHILHLLIAISLVTAAYIGTKRQQKKQGSQKSKG